MADAGAAVGVILGSAFSQEAPRGLALEPLDVRTRHGMHRLERLRGPAREAYVDFRHGRPHRLLPHQIDYRAQLAAFAEVGCGALLVTSSVGVLEAQLPLYRPLRVVDLLTLDNRLPDGSACTLYREPSPEQGHLVLHEGLFSHALGEQLDQLASDAGAPLAADVIFGYAAGPRTKTRAENEMWRRLGAQVNSMSVGPEVVLANELQIPCAALVVGHKYSLARGAGPADAAEVARSLQDSRAALERIACAFLQRARPVRFTNHIHRFGA